MEHYDRMGEFHDLFMRAPWERLRPDVAAAFADLGEDAVVVEIGAGSGMGVRVIGQESRARVVALEPNPVMRSILTARVFDDGDLASRVTVAAGSAPGGLALLPRSVDGFVCAHMLGHLTGEEHRGLFSWLDGALAPGGRGLVTVQEPRPEDTAARERTEEVVLGGYRYRVDHLPEPDGRTYVTRYRVLAGDEVVREERFTGEWEPFTRGALAAALEGTGLVGGEPRSGVCVVRRSP